ncbi:MAG: RdgB/HAM1 family non-canonical purine NTP pyrophosphatase [Eggerthellaceae bacterium]|nr:RdgB/HAM1 family non-canonical purine NTP pyrophosphatase [Eggerthellaceae bacterium]
MTKTVVIASNNAHKADEIRGALDFEGWEFKTLAELGIASDPDEDADTFEGNARIKALAAHEASGGLAALADDSGLIVDALDGAPGVYSSRYAGEHGNDGDNNAKLLKELENVKPADRTARFACCLVFIDEDDTETVALGTVEGLIGYEARGENGFGYDPLFLPVELDGETTFAQISQDEKAKLSHRGNALRALKAKLSDE